jgi:hypothetical protein
LRHLFFLRVPAGGLVAVGLCRACFYAVQRENEALELPFRVLRRLLRGV